MVAGIIGALLGSQLLILIFHGCTNDKSQQRDYLLMFLFLLLAEVILVASKL